MQCLLGKMATERFAQMPNHLFHLKWYALPIKMRKYFILMLANTQQPLLFDGFGMYVLNLDSFTSVSENNYHRIKIETLQNFIFF